MKSLLYVFDMDRPEKKAEVDRLLRELGWADLERFYVSEAGIIPTAEYRLLFPQDDPALDRLIDGLKEAEILYRLDRCYTRRELLQAELLELQVTGVLGEVKNEPFAESPGCRYCGHYRYWPRTQVADLVVDKRLMGKKDIAATYGMEIVVTERVARLFEEARLTGYQLRPVQHHSTRLHPEPVLYQVIPTNLLPPMASPPTRVKPCPVCGQPLHDGWSQIFYRRSDLERAGVKDFNRAQERYLMAISQRVYRLLSEHRLRKFRVDVIRILD